MWHRSRRARWLALVSAVAFVLGLVVFAQRAHAAPPQQADADQALAEALFLKDYPSLLGMAAPQINVVNWLGDRQMLSADDALEMLKSDYLDPATAPYVDSTTNLTEWFGIDPIGLWQDAVPVSSVIYLRGLGAEGAGEALLGMDAGQWTALLLAASGLGTPDARDANSIPTLPAPAETAGAAAAADAAPAAADASLLTILRTVNVYGEPNPDAVPVGLLRRNQTLPLLGVSADDEYLQIECPATVADTCWVVNDPGSVELLREAMTATPVPAALAAPAVSAPAPERITFATGEVSANRMGVVSPDAPVSYVLRVLAGQMLTVDLISGGNAANFAVTGAANGQPYKRMSNEARNWTFTVPVTQDYIIRLEASVPTQYSLTVVAPPLAAQPTPTATPLPVPTAATPERIAFAQGETSAERAGRLNANQSKAYVLRVLAGQDVITSIYSTGSLSYSIIAADGTPIKRREVGGNPFTFTAPATQDYRITVYADVALEYGLTVSVPPLATPPTATPAAPTRLHVAPGGTDVSVTSIVAAYGRDQYLVGAVGGQTMYVSIESPDAIANFSIVGVRDGQPLKRLENEDRTWTGTLPATQDYLITVANPRGVRVRYTLYVSFSPLQGNAPTPTPRPSGPPQRISFPAGGTSATLAGNAPQTYVLRALAGQTMSVHLDAQGNAAFSVAGSDGQVLKSSGAGGADWYGVLPSNQDYYITVIPVSGSTAFTLFVSVVF